MISKSHLPTDYLLNSLIKQYYLQLENCNCLSNEEKVKQNDNGNKQK